MTEPTSTSAAATAAGGLRTAAGGLSLVAGSVFGLPIAALVFGFAGALFSLKIDETERNLWARVTSVAMGTIVAAVTAYPVAEWLHPEGSVTASWVPAAAILIGAGCEILLKTGINALVSRLKQLGGQS